MRRLLTVLITLSLVAPVTAGAQASGVIERAARSLADDPVYVHPDASPTISTAEASALRSRIAGAGGGIYVAVLPDAAVADAGSPEAVLRALARTLRREGTYAVVAGGRFRAGSNRDEGASVARIAADAYTEHRREGVAPTLLAFVDGIASARTGDAQAAADDQDDGYGAAGLGVLVALVGGGATLLAVRRRRRAAAELAEVKEAAEEDLVALADDVRSLDLDIEMPNVDPRAREEYSRAVAAYDRASGAFRRARSVDDLERVSEAVEEGRYAIAATRALLAGHEPPERRPPCFFDPRHGPSVEDVAWTPPYGEERLVPVCAADAVRIAEGEDPDVRHVRADGELVPYWSAGPAYGPWAGGFFGGMTGALLPTLLVGSMLGGGLGFGVPTASADPGGWGGDNFGGGDGGFGDLGDVGGGDFGDFGGGDFGGGDFGGGDMGGGDF